MRRRRPAAAARHKNSANAPPSQPQTKLTRNESNFSARTNQKKKRRKNHSKPVESKRRTPQQHRPRSILENCGSSYINTRTHTLTHARVHVVPQEARKGGYPPQVKPKRKCQPNRCANRFTTTRARAGERISGFRSSRRLEHTR